MTREILNVEACGVPDSLALAGKYGHRKDDEINSSDDIFAHCSFSISISIWDLAY
jgi:hypothetical protein